ncbi:MAG: RNA polymerase sigma factor [Candidatus Omnitrophica bacterium]|nr:RNA polymerase sigma factor [Candidatus Omnitrophota bacterium]MCM8809675.1 RNA polymerase sigma factor [Candidatus Omnitrophota bacterium]MCM8810555.1 RNA polymerase sigma factor [Candidatus Omnitrophota bacterium]MCM8832512.1 RNA polymerase sigma factor [Candidatus Omnitrophota bacterium]
MIDEKKFEEYYLTYANKIYGLAFKLLNNHDDALDIVQESFFRAYKNRNNFKGLSKFTTYLYRIAVNLSYDFLRKKYRIKKIENLNYENFSSYSNRSNFEDCIHYDDIVEKIEKEVDNLTEKQKIVFILKTYEGLTYQEIANILKSRIGTVKATYFQSLQKIRENLIKKGVIKNEM